MTLWSTARLYSRPTVRAGMIVGASAALAALTKAVAAPYPILFALVVIALALSQRGLGKQAALPRPAFAAPFVFWS